MGQLISVIHSSHKYQQISREGAEGRDSRGNLLAAMIYISMDYHGPCERLEKAQPKKSQGSAEGRPGVPA